MTKFGVVFLVLASCIVSSTANAEIGWKTLFNGENLDGWVTHGDQDWSVKDGKIVSKAKAPKVGWLYTDKKYDNFVLRLRVRWQNGDSGIQFRTYLHSDGMATGYQANLDANRKFATGSLLYETNGKPDIVAESKVPAEELLPKNVWTEYEISAIGKHIQLRVNGVKTADYREKNKTKPGIIALQMNSKEDATIEWADIRILELSADDDWKPLSNGKDLSCWETLGDATWGVEDGAMVGKARSKDGGYGWLVSKEKYMDFHFATRFHMAKGNSGIQFRSWAVDNMIHGFQADLASGSDWISGHLYDQSERGIFVKTDIDFTDIIDWEGWNTYEITAIGPKVELFINGIKSLETSDPTRLRKGVFAFQIHSRQLMETRWKDVRIIPMDKPEK